MALPIPEDLKKNKKKEVSGEAVDKVSPTSDDFSLPDLSSILGKKEAKPVENVSKKRRKKPGLPVSDLPVKKKVEPASPSDSFFDENGNEWRIHAKTGKKYRVIPESRYSGGGQEGVSASSFKGKSEFARPELTVPDFDADDLNSEADTFLAHLRVPPSKDEMERLRSDRARKVRQLKENQ